MIRVIGMHYRVAIEDIETAHFVAWVLDLPGCFSSAATEEEALSRAPERIAAYYTWIEGHDPSLPAVSGPSEVQLIEIHRSYESAECPGYLVNAFFQDDRQPLGYWDIEAALRLLDWSRLDLLETVRPLSREMLHEPIAGEARDTIAGILDHVAVAENWYLGQLDLGLARSSLPEDPMEKLGVVRANARARLATLINHDETTTRCDETWSARKIVRRALWHERDHTQHIANIVARLGRGE